MARVIRIGNAHGFWGDRLEAAAEMLAAEPDLDFLTLDFLAEVSMSILALQRSRDAEAGWPRDFAEIVRWLAPYWQGGGRCRVVTNAGGLNPLGCAMACREILRANGCGHVSIGVVTGDDVLEIIRAEPALPNPEPPTPNPARLVTANAYLGGEPIARALDMGAWLVITGRVADPSLTVGPCVHAFGWPWDQWDRLAGATVAGHLIECGTQVAGGIATDWLDVPDPAHIGFPIVEVYDDGSCVITKPRGTGGRVMANTVKEQLVYEIGDPAAYLSPDVTVSFLSLAVDDEGHDRVRVRGAAGRPPPPTLKVSATWQDGYRAAGELTIFGADAVPKARRAAEAVFQRLRDNGIVLRQTLVECLGTGVCRPPGVAATPTPLTETVLRIAVADDSRAAVERFARELMPLVTAGPPGTTGYAAGRPHVQPVFRYWPCLIDRGRVTPRVELLPGDNAPPAHVESVNPSRGVSPRHTGAARPGSELAPSAPPRRLIDVALARSGDKGIDANIGVIARRPEDFDWLRGWLTAERVAEYLGLADARRVERYELPNLAALNFVVRGILADVLRTDAQGKALGQVLLEMPIP